MLAQSRNELKLLHQRMEIPHFSLNCVFLLVFPIEISVIFLKVMVKAINGPDLPA
jgi:hypothetical protein